MRNLSLGEGEGIGSAYIDAFVWFVLPHGLQLLDNGLAAGQFALEIVVAAGPRHDHALYSNVPAHSRGRPR